MLSAPDLATVLLEVELAPSGAPPRRLKLGLALESSGDSRVLVIGGALPATAFAGLRKRGCHVDVALDFAAAVRRMRRDRYDVVVTWPHVEGDADGLRFVRAFKQVAAAPPANTDARLLEQYARVPFLILPLDGTTEFALFASAKRWFLGDTNEVPLHRAILDACAFD